ncbi:hypothetical protein ACQ859_15100 [Roseateles chitinivorans]|uniref:hypothetical protein n=1 Tax=Roseateles chitinivorans TaxID=2917965 RepID=UPI003D679EE4
MPYQLVPLAELKSKHPLIQDLATTTLTQVELSRELGFVFEQVKDDISECEVCAVKSSSGEQFLVVCRNEVPEWQIAIRAAISSEPLESYVPRMLADFIDATGFDAERIERIWPFTLPRRPDAIVRCY